MLCPIISATAITCRGRKFPSAQELILLVLTTVYEAIGTAQLHLVSSSQWMVSLVKAPPSPKMPTHQNHWSQQQHNWGTAWLTSKLKTNKNLSSSSRESLGLGLKWNTKSSSILVSFADSGWSVIFVKRQLCLTGHSSRWTASASTLHPAALQLIESPL